MSEKDEAELFKRLSEDIQWDTTGMVENQESYLLAIDADCQHLLRVFETYCNTAKLAALSRDEKMKALGEIALLLEREFENLQDVAIDSMIQTRGEGLCMTFDHRGIPDDIQFLTDETRIRGELLGIHCLPVPTEYALITGVSDDENEYAPTLCLMLQAVNLEEFEDVATHDNLVAIPLRWDGMGFDQVIERKI